MIIEVYFFELFHIYFTSVTVTAAKTRKEIKCPPLKDRHQGFLSLMRLRTRLYAVLLKAVSNPKGPLRGRYLFAGMRDFV